MKQNKPRNKNINTHNWPLTGNSTEKGNFSTNSAGTMVVDIHVQKKNLTHNSFFTPYTKIN